MRDPLILAHDIGTSGTKSALVRPDGLIVASETTAHRTHFPRPGWAEQQPVDWWEGVCRNTAALTAGHSELRRRVVGIGVSGHMLGCLPVDSEGRALRPCMIHSDCRAAGPCEIVRKRIGPGRHLRTDRQHPRPAIQLVQGSLGQGERAGRLRADSPFSPVEGLYRRPYDRELRLDGLLGCLPCAMAGHQSEVLCCGRVRRAWDRLAEVPGFAPLDRRGRQVDPRGRAGPRPAGGHPRRGWRRRRLVRLGRGRHREHRRHLLLSRHHGLDRDNKCGTVDRQTATCIQRSCSRWREQRGVWHGPSCRPLRELGHGLARGDRFRSI